MSEVTHRLLSNVTFLFRSDNTSQSPDSLRLHHKIHRAHLPSFDTSSLFLKFTTAFPPFSQNSSAFCVSLLNISPAPPHHLCSHMKLQSSISLSWWHFFFLFWNPTWKITFWLPAWFYTRVPSWCDLLLVSAWDTHWLAKIVHYQFCRKLIAYLKNYTFAI